MTPENLKSLGSYLTSHGLAAKSINDFSKKEITDLVNYICDQFGKSRPIPIMYDHADRLIVPANADQGGASCGNALKDRGI